MPILFACSNQTDKTLIEKMRLDGTVSLLSENPFLPHPESTHADMQILPVKDDTVFIKNGICSHFIEDIGKISKRAVISGGDYYEAYPSCCSHNILICGNYYFHNTKYTDENVKQFLDANYFIPVNVRQGYSGCSSCYIDSIDLLITSDRGIQKESAKHSFNCCFIDENITERIELKGYDHGFIGGCLGYCKETNTLYVNGSIEKNMPELYGLLRQAGVRVVQSDKKTLSDIGGIKCIVYKASNFC